ncbi:MAG: hypothetical protein ACN6OP_09160 [Pseudomonadales bacterium]
MAQMLDDFSLLVDLKGPDDLTSRPAYCPYLEASDAKLSEVLAPYYFDVSYPCGLASCRQPHQNGFLVITDDGVETNVGGDCGKRIFGDDFVIKSNLQRRRADFKYQLETLQRIRDDKVNILARISDFYDRRHGTKWADASLKRLKEYIGRSTSLKLHEMARRGETLVEHARDATAEERERHAAMNSDSKPLRYVIEKLGELRGLGFLNSDPHQMATELKNRIFELQHLDAKALSARKRQEWVNWANNIDRNFDAVEESLAEALRFFSDDNMLLVHKLDAIEKQRV